MVTNSNAKLKVLELTPEGTANGSWGLGWTNYTSARFETRIAKAAALGANACTIVTEGRAAYNYPSATLMDYYMGDYCALLRKYGLKHYLKLAGGVNEFTDGTTSGRNAAVVDMMTCLANFMKHGSDLVVGGDVCNEINFGVPSYASGSLGNDLAYLLAAARATAPGVPFSFSVYLNSAADLTGTLVKMQSQLGCDFHDVHPYFSKNNSATLSASDAPSTSGFAALENASWFLGRHFAGECGIVTGNTAAAITAWISGQAAIAALPKSLGGVMFGDQNFQTYNYGIVGVPSAEAAFLAWPRSQL